jgi:hypothetical protein
MKLRQGVLIEPKARFLAGCKPISRGMQGFLAQDVPATQVLTYFIFVSY